jgi:hypothetical protein
MRWRPTATAYRLLMVGYSQGDSRVSSNAKSIWRNLAWAAQSDTALPSRTSRRWIPSKRRQPARWGWVLYRDNRLRGADHAERKRSKGGPLSARSAFNDERNGCVAEGLLLGWRPSSTFSATAAYRFAPQCPLFELARSPRVTGWALSSLAACDRLADREFSVVGNAESGPVPSSRRSRVTCPHARNGSLVISSRGTGMG